MDRSLRIRTFILSAIVGFCVLYLLPTFAGNRLPSWYTDLFEKRINLGLDLQGGAHFVYSINLNKAVEDKASEIKRDVEAKLEDRGIKAQVTNPGKVLGGITVRLNDPDPAVQEKQRAEVAKLMTSDYGDIVTGRTCDGPDGVAVCVRISGKFAEGVRKSALAQALTTIRDRIDERGVAEPTVISKEDQIIVELPGLGDAATKRVQELISRTAKLEFKIVAHDSDYMKAVFRKTGTVESQTDDNPAKALGIVAYTDGWVHEKSGKEFSDYFLTAHDREQSLTREEAEARDCEWDTKRVEDGKLRCTVKGRKVIELYLKALAEQDPTLVLPDDYEIGYELAYPDPDDERTTDKRPYWRSYYLEKAVRLTGSAVSNAVVSYDPNTLRPEVAVEFNRYGGRQFGDLTSNNVGAKMAIILDGKVASAPIIQGAIRQGRSSITMGGNDARTQEREAQDLVNVLKTGSLPAPLQEESVAQLGPTLGADAVDKAQLSFALGILLVIVIMVGIYKWSGTIACATVIINLLIQVAVMCMFDATLTLPGIAALVLTVGMAVDGNVLIYERIRDELNLGKSVKGAVDIGFSRAFSSILDGNLTTAAAGWVLLQYGSGPIHGFAVLLLIGLGTTLFTNTWVTRLFFDHYIAKKRGDLATISI